MEVDDNIVSPSWAGFDLDKYISSSCPLVGKTIFNYLDTTQLITDGSFYYTKVNPEINAYPSGIKGVPLKNGKRYIVSVYWDGSNQGNSPTGISSTYNLPYSPDVINSLIYAGGVWHLDGFIDGQGVSYKNAVRAFIKLASLTDVKLLPEASFNVYPNPTADKLNLQFGFLENTDATMTIADINGYILKIDDRQGLSNELISYDLSAYPDGTYIVRVATKVGTRTARFVVTH